MSGGPLAGRRALVTGASRGIGAAIAERLAADGADVTAASSSDVDFTDRAASEAYAELAAGEGYAILVNNAGINAVAPFAEIDLADFDRIHEVNVRAPLLLCRALVGPMRAAGWGRIVNIGSVFGTVSKEERASYSASKFGLDGLTAALAAEVAADGVLVNTVSPGFVDTELTRRVLGEEGIARMAAQVPARRLAQPAEIAALVAWLAGPDNTYLSGQNVVIDGGFTRV
jgi:NAD(P)-dependent dehydrogenase (short-subunit alcohol dehydrogenase family)